LVASCDCFVIIMFPGKEKFEYDLLRHNAFQIVREIVIEAYKKFKSSMKYEAGTC